LEPLCKHDTTKWRREVGVRLRGFRVMGTLG
jgi:hypothetical protein